MKFELKPYNRGVSDDQVLNDVKAVASKLSKPTLSENDYRQHGRYNYSTVTRRFGSWNKAMAMADLEITHYHKIEDAELLEDLKSVASKVGKKTLTQSEYKTYGNYSVDSFKDHFGSWNAALNLVGLDKSKNVYITEEQLFENLEEVWIKLGRQPYYGDIAKPLSKYSKDVYARRFGSWRKALEAFVTSVNGNDEELTTEQKLPTLAQSETKTHTETHTHKTRRNINWRLRFVVMKRDNFKCQSCGRSPATDPTVILHVDHKKAWANGGETVLENLQTLCSVCNIGKSNL